MAWANGQDGGVEASRTVLILGHAETSSSALPHAADTHAQASVTDMHLQLRAYLGKSS